MKFTYFAHFITEDKTTLEAGQGNIIYVTDSLIQDEEDMIRLEDSITAKARSENRDAHKVFITALNLLHTLKDTDPIEQAIQESLRKGMN